nr:NADH dehydrogenase subunit 6 [Novaculichthys taeniourus]
MSYVMMMLLGGLVLGLVAVASNPSPYFAALGLVVVAGMGCGVVVGHGGPFLSLVLFLIYLGGMLVVFAYSAALAAEPYPENWFDASVAVYMLVYVLGVVVAGAFFCGGWYEMSLVPGDDWENVGVFRADTAGVAFLYSLGGGMLVISAGVLLLTLFVVLELTRGLGRGTIRAV